VHALDTLGRLAAAGYGLTGHCLDCSARYRPDMPAAERVSSAWDVDMGALIAERGASAPTVGMLPLSCPRCGSVRTEFRLRALGAWDGQLRR